jgi:hypothetical protein
MQDDHKYILLFVEITLYEKIMSKRIKQNRPNLADSYLATWTNKTDYGYEATMHSGQN